MVIRFTKATRFFFICVMLLVTALISIGTRSMSVSAPYHARTNALPMVIYRNTATAPSLRDIRRDLDHLAESGYTVLSEQMLVATLRRESELLGNPVLLLFDESDEAFFEGIEPLLVERELPWFSLEQSTMLTRELRAAGFPVTRLERTEAFTLEEQMNVR